LTINRSPLTILFVRLTKPFFFLLLFCLLLHRSTLNAQNQETDSVSTQTYTSSSKQEYKPFTPTKSALLAVGLSAALPGAGQFYNENYWKVPVIWGLGGYWIYEWVDLNKNYQNYRTLYSESIIETDPDGNNNYLNQRDFYRDERDKFAWYLGVLYFVNVIDAYVGANLYDFEVTPDLGSDGRMLPRVTASVKLTF